MKNLITIFSSLILLLCSCSKEAPKNLEPRLDALEKALAIKDAQIAGLSEMAYIQALDTVALVSDSFNLASIIFASHQLPLPASCRATCARKRQTHFNICLHVPPQNQIWCFQQAMRNYNTCIARCN